MQAFPITGAADPYTAGMKTGRPSKRPRTSFGQRLLALREAAGLSQAQAAEKLGIHQTSYADWERHPVALRPEQMQTLAGLLGVSVAELVAHGPAAKRGQGPTGKMRQLFTAASHLPRSQQQKVVAVLEAFVAQHTAVEKAS